MRKLLTLTMLAVLTVLGTGCATMFGEDKQKVVYHINYNDEKQLNAALGNVKNHINAIGKDKIDVKVVMHGAGLDLLKIANTDLNMQQKVIGLKKDGVAFQVCNNTLVNKKMDYKNDLFDVSKADIVPSGVAEVANLQQKGYVYIKP
ncbi:MAG TPA: DsrE family protein [Acidiferrobacterales bacterium]|nr:DsrE family protein [Acidiferrobacterales bacterium]